MDGSSFDNAIPLQLGVSHSMQMSEETGYRHYYIVEGLTDRSSYKSWAVATSGNVNLYMRVYDLNRRTIDFDNDSYGNRNPLVDGIITADGGVYIEVSQLNNARNTGTYNVTIEVDEEELPEPPSEGTSFETAITIDINEPFTWTMGGVYGFVHYYRVVGLKPDSPYSAWAWAASNLYINLAITIYNSSYEEIGYNDDYNGTDINPRIDNVMVTDGILYIKVTQFWTNQGSYSVGIDGDASGVVPVESVEIDQGSTITVPSGTTSQLTATISPANASDKLVVWFTDNPDIADVDNNGIVTGRLPGTATITARSASYPEITDTIEVTVPETEVIRVTGVHFNNREEVVDIGTSKQVQWTVEPPDATDKRVTFYSGNNNIVAISQSGIITGITGGETTITVVTEDGGFTDTIKVVCFVPLRGIGVNPGTPYVGQPYAPEIIYVPANATNKKYKIEPVRTDLNWTIWSDEYDEHATLTFMEPAYMRLSVTSEDGGFTQQFLVQAVNPGGSSSSDPKRAEVASVGDTVSGGHTITSGDDRVTVQGRPIAVNGSTISGSTDTLVGEWEVLVNGVSLVAKGDKTVEGKEVTSGDDRVWVDKGGGIPISTWDEFLSIGVDSDKPMNGNYYLANDIDCSGLDLEYYEGGIGAFVAYDAYIPFVGTLDGRGHSFKNIRSVGSTDSDRFGVLFNMVKGATIKNVGFEEIYIWYTGIVAKQIGIIAFYAIESTFENIITYPARELETGETMNTINGYPFVWDTEYCMFSKWYLRHAVQTTPSVITSRNLMCRVSKILSDNEINVGVNTRQTLFSGSIGLIAEQCAIIGYPIELANTAGAFDIDIRDSYVNGYVGSKYVESNDSIIRYFASGSSGATIKLTNCYFALATVKSKIGRASNLASTGLQSHGFEPIDVNADNTFSIVSCYDAYYLRNDTLRQADFVNSKGINNIIDDEKMFNSSTFTGWDFDEVWDIRPGSRPFLRWMTEFVSTINEYRKEAVVLDISPEIGNGFTYAEAQTVIREPFTSGKLIPEYTGTTPGGVPIYTDGYWNGSGMLTGYDSYTSYIEQILATQNNYFRPLMPVGAISSSNPARHFLGDRYVVLNAGVEVQYAGRRYPGVTGLNVDMFRNQSITLQIVPAFIDGSAEITFTSEPNGMGQVLRRQVIYGGEINSVSFTVTTDRICWDFSPNFYIVGIITQRNDFVRALGYTTHYLQHTPGQLFKGGTIFDSIGNARISGYEIGMDSVDPTGQYSFYSGGFNHLFGTGSSASKGRTPWWYRNRLRLWNWSVNLKLVYGNYNKSVVPIS